MIKIATTFCRYHIYAFFTYAFSWLYNNCNGYFFMKKTINLHTNAMSPCPLTFPQFANMIQFKDTFILSLLDAQAYFLMNIHYGPKSIGTLSLSSPPPSILALDPWPWHWPSLCTQPYNFAHILLQNIAKEVFFTTFHTSYCKHCTRSYYHRQVI